jgi:magnesium transporter
VLYAILDSVVDGYAPVVVGLANDIDEIESQVFGGDPGVSRRIYELSREVIDFERAARPLTLILDHLSNGFEKYGIGVDLQQYLRDVADLTVNATLVAQRQNEDMQAVAEASKLQVEETPKISAWAAILFAPSLVTGIYGMNLSKMPEFTRQQGYPIAVGAMLIISAALFMIFRKLRKL